MEMKVRLGFDRRSGDERRMIYDMEYLLLKDKERRSNKERRSGIERRKDWKKERNWSSFLR